MKFLIAAFSAALALRIAAPAAEPPPMEAASERKIDLASDTAWTLRCDDGPARPIKVPGGGWNSDQQSPPIQVLKDVKNFVLYERRIAVPADAAGQVVKIRFGAVTYSCEVYLDGKKMGEHAGPQVAFEIDLTPAVIPGKLQILQVKAFDRRHYMKPGETKYADIPVGWDYPEGGDDATRKLAAEWSVWHGQSKVGYGIVRSVELAILPAVYIQDVLVRPSVARKQLSCDVLLSNATNQDRKLTLSADLSSWNGTQWDYPQIPAISVTVPAGGSIKASMGPVSWNLGPASYWWPNIPYRENYLAQLHYLNFEVRQDRRLLEKRSQRFGFVEHTEGPFYYMVNGVRVTGFSDATAEGQMSFYDTYSSPAFLPPTGPGTGAPESWRRYMRVGININRLHCSPPTEYMMEAADEVGFMLMPEAPIWQNSFCRYNPDTFPGTIQDFGRACRNHPCIARYSLANEINGPDGPAAFPGDWPRLIDDMRAVDDIHPLVFDLGRYPSMTVTGPKSGAHAWTAEHYSDINQKNGGGNVIRSMGESFTFTDHFGGFAVGARIMRMNDFAYMSPWSWINYWPNFLQGMNHNLHAWKHDDHADRKDGFDGWNSAPLRFVQRSLDPYLVQDHDILANNPGAPAGEEKGQAIWPYQLPVYCTGQAVERTVEVFNGGLSGNHFALSWSGHWDKPDGPVALSGGVIGPFILEPGFHSTQRIAFTMPSPGQDRRFYLVLQSLKDGQPVFVEDGVYFNVLQRKPATEASYLGGDDQTEGDWKGKYGKDGYELEVRESKLPAYAKFQWKSGGLWTWSNSTSDRRALEYFSDPPRADARVAAARFADNLEFDLDVGDTPRRLSIYHLDFDKVSRRQSVEFSDALTGLALDKREIGDFTQGRYQSWKIRGRVHVSIRKSSGPNANISGIFLDPL